MALSTHSANRRASNVSHTFWAPVLVFLVACSLACAAAYWKHQTVQSQAEIRFQHSADVVVDYIRGRFMHPVHGLEGVRGLFAATKKVSRAEYRAYVESRDIDRQFVGVRGFGFVQRVQRSDLAAFIATERADGAPQFALRQLADKSHDDFYIVKYLEPAANNPGAQGVDIGSEAKRRAAVQQAVDTGMPTMTAAIKLVQDQRQTAGVLVFVPVYAVGAPTTSVAERRAALIGLLGAPLVMSELLDGMTAVKDGLVDFELLDAPLTPAGAPGGALLFDADKHTAASAAIAATNPSNVTVAHFSETRRLPLLGRELSLRVNSTAKADADLDQSSSWLILGIGAMLSALIAYLLRRQLIERRQLEVSAHTHRDELQLQKYALDQHAIVATTDVQGRITYVNDKFCDISGYSREELMGQDHSLLNSGTHPHGFFKAMYRTVAKGTTWRDEVCNRAQDGLLYWVDTTIVPVMDGEGKPERYLAIRADITMRKLAEQDLKLQKAELDLQKYALDQHAIVATTDVQGRITYINDKFCDISGYSREELMGQDHSMLNSGTHPHGFFKAMYRTVATGATWRDEVCNRDKNGLLYWVDTTIVPVMNSEGKPDRYLAIRADITKRKLAEQDLKLQKAELDLQKYALDQHAIVATTDVQGRITYINDKFCDISGYSREELMGQDHSMLNSGTHPHGFFKAMYRTVASGETWHNEVCNRAKGGHLYWVDTTIVPVMNSEGKPERYLAIRADITMRKQVELDLMEQQLTLERRVKQKSRAAILSEQHLRQVMNTSLDAIIGMDASGCVTEWNDQAERTFGWTFAEMQGQPLYKTIFPERLRQAHQNGPARYLASGLGPLPGKRVEVVALRRDGSEFPADLAISPIVTPQGTAFSTFLSDISQRKQEQASLMAAKALAESASRAKSEFLANMSHEIRTPMNGVIGMVDILQESGLAPGQRRMLGTIQNSSLALLQILNDILDFSKVEAGIFSVESVPIQLRQVAGGVVDLLASGAGAKVSLSLEVAAAIPDWTLGDPTRLRQVLLNLLGNALKFSNKSDGREAEVRLSVTPCARADGTRGVRLAVADNGIGISSTAVAKLFQPFTQADESTSRKFGGTGLGLSITRGLVELMGGDISVSSTLGKGSEFVVELPLLPCEPGLAVVTERPPGERRVAHRGPTLTPDEAKQAGQLILLAEDNEINREVMQEQLRLLGYTCELAVDGAMALEMWQSNPGRYGLLLSDCHMPNLDGFGLTAAIRASETVGGHMPIIAVTANAMPGESQRCLEHGMDDYLSKPLRLEELSAKLERWLPVAMMTAVASVGHPESQEAEPVTAAKSSGQPSPAPLAIWSSTTLITLVGDNPGMHRRLLIKFLTNAERQVAEISTAAAATDTATVASVAHALKSAARSVGALAMGELCQDLETAGRAGDGTQCKALAAGLAGEFESVAAAINDFERTNRAGL